MESSNMRKTAITDAKLIEPIFERWSPRSFNPDSKISDEVLQELVEAARWAPSSRNEQPWRFLLFGIDDKFRLDVESALVSGNKWATKASHLLVVCSSRNFDYNERPNNHYKYDTGSAVMSLILQAMSRNIYSHQMAGFDRDSLRKILSVPDSYDIIVVIALGYIYDNLEEANLDEELIEKEIKARNRKTIDLLMASGKRWNFTK